MKIFKNWAEKRKIKKVISRCDEIYQGISGFHLAKQARELEQKFSYEYIYGEVDYHSLAKLLSYCEITSDTCFCDLGSGIGKAVVFCSLLYDFRGLIGIEKLELLHESSLKVLKGLPDNKIDFINHDILEVDWTSSHLILVNAATYIGEFWEALKDKLLTLKPGTQIIVISKQLPNDSFQLVYEAYLPMSWGITRAGVYRASNFK